MRRGEEFGLDWENVDFENDIIRVRRSLFWKHGKYQERAQGDLSYLFVTPKTKESIRDIDLSPALRKKLRELYLKSGKKGLVFSTDCRAPLDPDNITKRDFCRAIKAADEKRGKNNLPLIGKVRWHDLRHTFGGLKIEQGENVKYVQKQMGHSSAALTMDIYTHLLNDSKPEAAAKTDAMIFGA